MIRYSGKKYDQKIAHLNGRTKEVRILTSLINQPIEQISNKKQAVFSSRV